MDRVQDESVRLGYPDLADVFVRCKAAEGLEPACGFAGCHEVRQVGAQLVMAVVMEALDGRVLDGSVHSLDLAVCRDNSPLDCYLILQTPRMVGIGRPVRDPIGLAGHVEAHGPGVDGVPGPLCELDTVVGENVMDLIRHGIEHVLQELPSRLPCRRIGSRRTCSCGRCRRTGKACLRRSEPRRCRYGRTLWGSA